VVPGAYVLMSTLSAVVASDSLRLGDQSIVGAPQQALSLFTFTTAARLASYAKTWFHSALHSDVFVLYSPCYYAAVQNWCERFQGLEYWVCRYPV